MKNSVALCQISVLLQIKSVHAYNIRFIQSLTTCFLWTPKMPYLHLIHPVRRLCYVKINQSSCFNRLKGNSPIYHYPLMLCQNFFLFQRLSNLPVTRLSFMVMHKSATHANLLVYPDLQLIAQTCAFMLSSFMDFQYIRSKK